jgi:hypothetical protein
LKNPFRALVRAHTLPAALALVFFVATCADPTERVVRSRRCWGQIANEYQAVFTYDPTTANTTLVVTGTNHCDETPVTIDRLSVTLYTKDASGKRVANGTTTVSGGTTTISTPSDTERLGFSAWIRAQQEVVTGTVSF